jgi:hypothetical protein
MKLPSKPTILPIPSAERCRIIKAGLEAWIRANPKEKRGEKREAKEQ